MVVALTSELSVLADRLATLEALSGVGHAAVDAHVPDLGERERREARREALIARVFAALEVELEGKEPGDYLETIGRIERGEV